MVNAWPYDWIIEELLKQHAKEPGDITEEVWIGEASPSGVSQEFAEVEA